MVQYFIDGGPFMWPILISLIFGLGFAFERAYSLIISSINSQKFYEDISTILENESVQAAVDLCDKTPGPVAEVFHAGLTRFHRGLREVEKAVQNAGSLEMSFLEKNMIWLNTVITVAPMIGLPSSFFGNRSSGGFILTCWTGLEVISPPIRFSTTSSSLSETKALKTAGPHQNGVSGLTSEKGNEKSKY